VRWLVLVALVGCGSSKAPPENRPIANVRAPSTVRLFDRLGGTGGIRKIVEAWLRVIVADGRINSYFANSDFAELREALADQICELAGGPCRYTGKDMREAHAGMKLRGADFAAILEDLDKAMVQLQLGSDERQALRDPFVAMQADVVGR